MTTSETYYQYQLLEPTDRLIMGNAKRHSDHRTELRRIVDELSDSERAAWKEDAERERNKDEHRS